MINLKAAVYRHDGVTRQWNEFRLHHLDRLRGVVREDKYRWLADCSLSEGVILDVGANYGQSALAMRHHRPDRDVVCVEANPDLQPSLRKLVRRDPAIRYVMAAAGDRTGVAELTVPTFHGSQNTGGASIDATFLRRRTDELEARYGAEMQTLRHTVPMMRLDDLPVDVAAIKIDVEGLEASVLRGLSDTLTAAVRPPVFLEVRHSDGEAMELLVDLGYSLFQLTDNGACGPAVSIRQALDADLQDVLALG